MAYKEYMQDKSMKFSDIKSEKDFERKKEALQMQLDGADSIAEKQIIANRINQLEKFQFNREQKLGTMGPLQKDIEAFSKMTGENRVAALAFKKYPPDISSAIKELKMTGDVTPGTIDAYSKLYYGSEYKGRIIGNENPTAPGVYLSQDSTTLYFVDENGQATQQTI